MDSYFNMNWFRKLIGSSFGLDLDLDPFFSPTLSKSLYRITKVGNYETINSYKYYTGRRATGCSDGTSGLNPHRRPTKKEHHRIQNRIHRIQAMRGNSSLYPG